MSIQWPFQTVPLIKFRSILSPEMGTRCRRSMTAVALAAVAMQRHRQLEGGRLAHQTWLMLSMNQPAAVLLFLRILSSG